MDEFQIQAFITVVETKSFSRAAEILHITQSTVTSRIQALENRFGRPLLYRTTRRVETTEFGRKVLPHLTKILKLMYESSTIANLGETYDNYFSIGMVESAAHSTIAKTIDVFRERHPKTSIHLMTDHSVNVIQAVMDGSIDIGIVYSLPKHPNIRTKEVHIDDIKLVANSILEFPNRPILSCDIDPQFFVRIDWSYDYINWFSQEFGKNFISGVEVSNANLALQVMRSGYHMGLFPMSMILPFIQLGFLQIVPYSPSIPIPSRALYSIHQKTPQKEELVLDWEFLI